MLKKVIKIFIVSLVILSLCGCSVSSLVTYQIFTTINGTKTQTSFANPSDLFSGFSKKSNLVVGVSTPIEAQIQRAKSLKEYIEMYETSGSKGNYDPKWVDTVFFGYYPQSEKVVDTDDMIEWIVLDKNEETKEALLMSKRVIDYIPYNNESANVTWEISSIRRFLNSDIYYFSFGRQDRRKIVNSFIKNEMNVTSGPIGGNDTYDKMFLLSLEEANKYLKYCELTGYGTTYIDSEGRALDYWLRSPGVTQNFATYVHKDGIVSNIGYYVNFGKGVRPCIRVKY